MATDDEQSITRDVVLDARLAEPVDVHRVDARRFPLGAGQVAEIVLTSQP